MKRLHGLLHEVLSDARYAVRVLLRDRVFTIASVLCLALGIGGTSAIFSVVRSVLWRPLPYANPEAIVAVWELDPQGRDNAVALPNFDDWAAEQTTLQAFGVARPMSFNLSGGDRPEHVGGVQVSAGVFEALGVQPAFGRVFGPDEDQPGADPVVLISHRLHDENFARDPAVVGRSLTIDGRPYTIVGVLPEHFELLGSAQDIVVPLGLFRESFPNFKFRGTHPSITAVGRLAPGEDLESARADLGAIAARLAGAYPDTNEGRAVAVEPLTEHMVGESRQPLLLLLAGAAIVLLIAAANVAGLLLARGSARSGEIAIRRALGAGPRRLVRQLLTESVVLGAMGGVMGLLVGAWGVELLSAALADTLPRIGAMEFDLSFVAFAATTTLGVSFAFGLAPALWTVRLGGRGDTSRLSAQRWLVGGEIALAIVLLVGSGLTLRSLHRMTQVDLGFSPQQVVHARLHLTKARYPDAASWVTVLRDLRSRIQTIPGVQQSSFGTIAPMISYTNTCAVTSADAPAARASELDTALHFVVGPDYFDALGMRLLRGRTFEGADFVDGWEVAVVDRGLAEAYWPGQDPIGKRVHQGGTEDRAWKTVIGVVDSVQHLGVREQRLFQIFSPLDHRRAQGLAEFSMPLSIVVRARGDLDPVALALRDAVLAIDRDQPIYDVGPMTEVVDARFTTDRALTLLLVVFGALAVTLAAIGLYGVVGYSVGRRTREIGIRMAIGATRGAVVRLVLGGALRLIVGGLVVGLLAAAALSRTVQAVLFQVAPLDPLTYVATAVFVLCVALLASFVPARRAASIDPMSALRRP